MLDPSRLKLGDIIALAGGALLIASLFLDWYSVSGASLIGGGPHSFPETLVPPGFDVEVPGAPSVPNVDGWNALGFIDFVLLLTGLVAVKQAGIRIAGLRARAPFPIAALTTALAGVAMTLVLWRVFDPVGDGDLKVGVWLALVATALIGAGGYLAARGDGFDFYESEGAPGSGGTAAAAGKATAKTAAAKPKPRLRIKR